MKRYSTSKKRIWIPFVAILFIAAIVVYISYKDFYLSATVLIIPLFFLPTIIRNRRGDPDLIIIDTKLIIRGIPINKEFDLSEYYEFKIEKSILNIKGIYGYKLIDEITKRDLLVRPIYQDSLEVIMKKFYYKTM
ncbi:MAG: hypothetical protein KAJ22_02760 [Candidatus Izimaplasma sp.]|nr:hypothetical protein [Candidatus Izimaplasma bacterium]